MNDARRYRGNAAECLLAAKLYTPQHPICENFKAIDVPWWTRSTIWRAPPRRGPLVVSRVSWQHARMSVSNRSAERTRPGWTSGAIPLATHHPAHRT
jgi:hypothetical protein